MDHFPCGITAERAGVDNLAMLCISCGSALYFCHFVRKLAAFGDAATITGLRSITGSSLPVMAQGIAGS